MYAFKNIMKNDKDQVEYLTDDILNKFFRIANIDPNSDNFSWTQLLDGLKKKELQIPAAK